MTAVPAKFDFSMSEIIVIIVIIISIIIIIIIIVIISIIMTIIIVIKTTTKIHWKSSGNRTEAENKKYLVSSVTVVS